MNFTDCKSEEGVTVGLIDALISISRVLAKRDLNVKSGPIYEALADLRDDQDFNFIVQTARKLK